MWTQTKSFISNYVVSWRYWKRKRELEKSQSEGLERGGPFWQLKLRWMGTQRVQMKGVPPWLVRWACRAGTRDFCSALAALVGSVQNICFLTVHYFPIAQQSWQAAVLGHLSLSVWSGYITWTFRENVKKGYAHCPILTCSARIIEGNNKNY